MPASISLATMTIRFTSCSQIICQKLGGKQGDKHTHPIHNAQHEQQGCGSVSPDKSTPFPMHTALLFMPPINHNANNSSNNNANNNNTNTNNSNSTNNSSKGLSHFGKESGTGPCVAMYALSFRNPSTKFALT